MKALEKPTSDGPRQGTAIPPIMPLRSIHVPCGLTSFLLAVRGIAGVVPHARQVSKGFGCAGPWRTFDRVFVGRLEIAQVVELVDTQVSEACAYKHGGSSPPLGTNPVIMMEFSRIESPQTPS